MTTDSYKTAPYNAENFNGTVYKPDLDPPRAKISFGSFSRDEMNLAEFPLTVLSTRSDPTIKTLEFSDHVRMKSGELIERKWIITGADKFGLPTSTDDDVILGLIRLTMDTGFKSRKVYFSRYELLKALRWSTEGRSYSRLTKSLDRLSGVRIRAANSFYDNSSKSYQTRNFGLIDAYELNDNRSSKGESAPKSYFIWSEMLYDSFKSGFIKKLDLDIYFALKSAVSRRLYRYLDKNFYFRSVIEKPLLELAFEKIGLSRTYKFISSIKQQIEPAAQELVRIGFLSSYEIVGKGQSTIIRFISANSQGQSVVGIAAPISVPPISAASRMANPPASYLPAQPDPYTASHRAERSGEKSSANAATYANRAQDPLARFSKQPSGGASIGLTSHRPSLHREKSREISREMQREVHGEVRRDLSSSGEFTRPAPSPTAGNSTGAYGIGANGAGANEMGSSGYPSHQGGSGANELVEALVSRGIGVKQAVRLIERRTPADFALLDGILRYYDSLVESADSKVSRNKVGFLYRAVESPHRFSVPAAFLVGPGEGIAGSGRASNRGRRAADQGLQRERQKEQAEGEEAERQAYRQFLDQALVHSSTKLPSGELQQITASVEKKLSMLRTALSEARFREAVEGCVREELVKLLGLPDLAAWRRQR